jgi:hypothetical protein
LNQVQLYQTPPSGFGDQAIQSRFNNQMATAMAMGDPRMNAKTYDRPGLSRGAAQWNQAGIDAAQRMSQGIADAYSENIQNNAFNADVALQGQLGQEQYGQALGGLQQQRAYADQMAALQRQQAVLGMAGGLLRGLMD